MQSQSPYLCQPHSRKPGRLYAWVSPAFMPPGIWAPVEHTWVTSYNCRLTPYPNIDAVKNAGASYWYCLGDFHPHPNKAHIVYCPNTLGMEQCLVGSNDPQSAGTIAHYGIDGVCHQLANQILFANSTQHTWQTVQRAQGYLTSSAIYGTYGRREYEWMQRRLACQVTVNYRPSLSILVVRASRILKLPRSHAVVQELETLRQGLLKQIDIVGYRPRRLKESAKMRVKEINAHINSFLKESACILAQQHEKYIPEVAFQQIFGIAPHEQIYLVDPHLFRFPE
jgi:hypothetical protein